VSERFSEAGTRLLDERLAAEDYGIGFDKVTGDTAGAIMSNARIVLTTVGLKEAADKLAQQLVEKRLAACVNIVGPIRSVYRWRDKIQNEAEYLLLVKTTAECAAQLRSTLQTLHPYELPECVELTVTGGSEEYLAWVAAEASSGE
jgi:periplasmic divalent cation tolerance protein